MLLSPLSGSDSGIDTSWSLETLNIMAQSGEQSRISSLPPPPGTSSRPFFEGMEQNIQKGSILSFKSCVLIDKCTEQSPISQVVSKAIPSVSFTKKVVAEFIGTFILIFAGTATAIVNQKTKGEESLIGLAASSGLAIMVVILSIGHISGAHANPSLTLAFATLRHFPWTQVPAYIGAQLLAATCASFILKFLFHPFMDGGVTVPSGSYAQAFALEFIISFNLMFVVTAVATDTRAVGELAGIAVGATVMMNILIAGPHSGASMNPARSLGPAIATGNYKGIWVYITAPVAGAVCGAAAYTSVRLNGDENLPTMSTRSFRR